MVATIDLHASRMVFGGAGGEESAPIDRGLRMAAARAAAVAVTAVTDGSGAVEAAERRERAQGRPLCLHGRARGRKDGCAGVWPRVWRLSRVPLLVSCEASQLTFQ